MRCSVGSTRTSCTTSTRAWTGVSERCALSVCCGWGSAGRWRRCGEGGRTGGAPRPADRRCRCKRSALGSWLRSSAWVRRCWRSSADRISKPLPLQLPVSYCPRRKSPWSRPQRRSRFRSLRPPAQAPIDPNPTGQPAGSVTDQVAKSQARRLVRRLQQCRRVNLTFLGCADVTASDIGLNVTIPELTEDRFTLTAAASSGNVFTSVRGADRVTGRTCTTADVRGCPRSGRW
jgi:hypothetical protein